MLAYNDVVPRKVIIHDGEPYEVMTSHVFRKQQRKPVNATKLRNLLTGRVVEHSFAVSDKVDEADMAKRPVKFIYEQKGEFWFHPEGKPAERFTIPAESIGDQKKWMKPNDTYDVRIFTNEDDEELIIGVDLPIKMDLRVKEAAPAVKGNTSSGALKAVVLETGATLYVPLFINEGDSVTINTDTGEYVGRADKA
ncbi:MAG: efp, elongation factor elongation factor [Patescibacteria group bacterium]|nr:efp, elongation factor elongation factor [Patescibacteria group bacterium]